MNPEPQPLDAQPPNVQPLSTLKSIISSSKPVNYVVKSLKRVVERSATKFVNYQKQQYAEKNALREKEIAAQKDNFFVDQEAESEKLRAQVKQQ